MDNNTIQRRVNPCEALRFGGSMLEIQVGGGPFPETFLAHEVLLSQRSEFFKRAKGNNLDPRDERSVISLPDDSTDIFRLYLHLVYTSQLATKGSEEWLQLCRLYILAQKLQDVNAKNHILDGMHTLLHEVALEPPMSVNMTPAIRGQIIRELYDGTPSKSKGRQLVVDFYAACANEDWLRDGQSHLPLDFVYDVAMRLIQKRPSTLFASSMNRSPSHYHELQPINIRPEETLSSDKSLPSEKSETSIGVFQFARGSNEFSIMKKPKVALEKAINMP